MSSRCLLGALEKSKCSWWRLSIKSELWAAADTENLPQLVRRVWLRSGHGMRPDKGPEWQAHCWQLWGPGWEYNGGPTYYISEYLNNIRFKNSKIKYDLTPYPKKCSFIKTGKVRFRAKPLIVLRPVTYYFVLSPQASSRIGRVLQYSMVS